MRDLLPDETTICSSLPHATDPATKGLSAKKMVPFWLTQGRPSASPKELALHENSPLTDAWASDRLSMAPTPVAPCCRRL